MSRLTPFEKNKIRTALYLELNSCFSKVSKHYKEYGSEEDREFLQALISSVRECIDGDPKTSAEKNTPQQSK